MGVRVHVPTSPFGIFTSNGRQSGYITFINLYNTINSDDKFLRCVFDGYRCVDYSHLFSV